jgi:cell division protein FtsB
VFWCLIGLALAGMMPCMVLPAWREYQDATVTEQVRALQTQDAQRELEIMRTRLDAIHNDPVVISRLARRELGFQTPDEQVFHVDDIDPTLASVTESSEFDLARKDRTSPVVAQLPAPLSRMASMLPDIDYDRIFCHSPARELILLLSISLFIAAFVIYWPKPNADATTPTSP